MKVGPVLVLIMGKKVETINSKVTIMVKSGIHLLGLGASVLVGITPLWSDSRLHGLRARAPALSASGECSACLERSESFRRVRAPKW